MGQNYICLDIGGTKVLGVVFDSNNNIVLKVKKKTKAEKGFAQVQDIIIKVVEELLETAGLDKSSVAAISAGAPGVIDEDNGIIIYAPNLPWRNYNIKKVIEDKFGIPFFIGNDANVGILGEWKYGCAKGKENVVAYFIGTGVGGGVILNNKLFSGSKHAGAELGHAVVNTEGPYCNCGQRGCVEALSSKIAMTRDIRIQIERGRKTVLKDLIPQENEVLKSKALKKALEEKDELAIEVVDKAIYYLAAGAGSLINIFNPDVFLLGGGVIESIGDYIMPRFNQHISQFAMPSILKGTEIMMSSMGDDSIVYGALALATK